MDMKALESGVYRYTFNSENLKLHFPVLQNYHEANHQTGKVLCQTLFLTMPQKFPC